MGDNQVTFKDWDHALAAVKKKLARGEITQGEYNAVVREAARNAPRTKGTQSTRQVLTRLFAERGT